MTSVKEEQKAREKQATEGESTSDISKAAADTTKSVSEGFTTSDSAPGTPAKTNRWQSPADGSGKVSGDDGTESLSENPTTVNLDSSLGSSSLTVGSLTSSTLSVGTVTSGEEGTERAESAVKKVTKIHYGSIIKILLSHSRSRGKSRRAEEIHSFTFAKWEVLILNRRIFLAHRLTLATRIYSHWQG